MDVLHQTLAGLERAILELACGIKRQNDNQKILCRIEQAERNIMSEVSEFAAKQNAFNDRFDKAVDGLSSDVDALKEEIRQLQNSPGAITPEDQASLDAIQARSEVMATKIEALDNLTPPIGVPTPV